MGFFERLFGTNTSTKAPTRKPVAPPATRPAPKSAPVKPEATAPQKPTTTAPQVAVADAVEPSATAQEPETVAAQEPEAVVAQEPETVALQEPETVAAQEPEAVVAQEPEAVVAQEPEAVVAQEPEAVVAQEPDEPQGAETRESVADPHLQKRLDTYFARLRREFPDGRIVRLNTQHKKLAERGAELRRLTGYEGRLDDFFALGGFAYQRSAGGRPTLPAEQTTSVEARLRERFPEDVPTVLAVQQADHRLYLDLRAAARREGCTVGDYLNHFRDD